MKMGFSFFVGLTAIFLVASSAAREINHKNINPQQYDTRDKTDDIHFYLWTQSNSGDNEYFTLVNGDAGRLGGSPFVASKKTYFITHGYTNSGLEQFILDAKTKILSLEDCNVISVDWEKLAFNIDYNLAAKEVYTVGPFTGTFIDWLVSETGMLTSDIQMAGHSLGSHVIGLAAQNVSSGQIARLTGLDPAGPDFYKCDSTQRLDKSQAFYVDIIHTNGGEEGDLTHEDLGMFAAIGDTDFYPNGGVSQPDCGLVVDAIGCSHLRSHEFWVESITAGPEYANGSNSTDRTFQAWPCNDWDSFDGGLCLDCGVDGCPNMGFHNNNGPYGTFYLRTYGSSPYAYGVAQ